MEQIKKFTATCVYSDEEDGVLRVAISDDGADPDNYFIISRLDEDDLAVDRCIGFQSESSEYELAAAIDALRLTASDLSVTLADSAAHQLGITHYHALLSGHHDLTRLQQYLCAICSNSSIKLSIDLHPGQTIMPT